MKKLAKKSLTLILVGELLILAGTLGGLGQWVPGLAYLSLAILAGAILALIGTIKARKVNGSFRSAFVCLILVIVLYLTAIILAFFKETSILVTTSGIIEEVAKIASIFVTYFTILGCIDVTGNSNVKEHGRKTSTWYSIAILVSAILGLLVSLLDFSAMPVVATILGIGALILEIVAYVMYIVLLFKTIKSL